MDAEALVVPAHAGVIPDDPAAEDAILRRPRTRGGHPCVRMEPKLATWSSPHTRGSSRDRIMAMVGYAVVPAHAGVILMRANGLSSADGRPRTRGGHPVIYANDDYEWWSSPHTRGSSWSYTLTAVGGVVVPAHAGVIPWRRRPRARARCRPRTRRGHPFVPLDREHIGKSSPHTRGSSRGARAARV